MMRVCDQEIMVAGRLIRIAGLAADSYEFLDDPEMMIDELRKCGDRIDLFTFIERVTFASPRYSYPMEWDNLAVLPISTFEHWWTKQVNDKTRNMARRAGKKGVTIREVALDEDLIRGIWSIYNECEIRQGKRFAHYGKDLATVRQMTTTFPERSVFIGAYLGERLIGFARLHCDETRTQAGLASILSLIEHRDKSPMNALVAETVRYCASRQIPNLVYSRFSDGNKKRDSLMEFKEHNGFQRVNLPRYYVPLTRLGSVAFRFRLHRSITDHIPETVVAKLRNARSLWYGLRPHIAKGH